VRAIAKVLEVSRSNLMERMKTPKRKRPNRYNKKADKRLLPLIREITDKRPTYGYRRVTALLNKPILGSVDKPVNHKRVYRVMRFNGLLLQRHTGRPNRTHDGKIVTLRSNMRWCSDVFSIQCWNGDRVHVAFALDTCDREAIGYIASTVGTNGACIRDLMVECMEYRFGQRDRLPHPIQWLSDNGPCFTAHETVQFGRHLGFEIRTTPAYSPESNGMAEAFVKTFKRDYVWFGDLSNAQTVMEQLPGWFEDYNEKAPHKGLGMQSPREFLRSQQNQVSNL